MTQIALADTPGLQGPWISRLATADNRIAGDIAAVAASGVVDLEGWSAFIDAYRR